MTAIPSRAQRVRVGICDYGVGNLRSVERAIECSGAAAVISDDAAVLSGCDGLILPGVGAFAVAAAALRERGLDAAVHAMVERRRPLLGICLGFQLLFTDSEEGDGARGLDIIAGHVRRLRPGGAKVPHMGWNRLHMHRPSVLLGGVDEGEHVYFVHSYAADVDAPSAVVASTDHGGAVVAAVEFGEVMGTQFHPEKSGAIGLRLYANFTAACALTATA